MLIGIEFIGSAIPVRDALLKAGVLCKQTNEKTLRITPPLTISKQAVDLFVDMMAEICDSLSRNKLDALKMDSMVSQLKTKYNIEPSFEKHRVDILQRITVECGLRARL